MLSKMNSTNYYHIVIRGEDLRREEAPEPPRIYKAPKPPVKKINPATYNMWEILANPEGKVLE